MAWGLAGESAAGFEQNEGRRENCKAIRWRGVLSRTRVCEKLQAIWWRGVLSRMSSGVGAARRVGERREVIQQPDEDAGGSTLLTGSTLERMIYVIPLIARVKALGSDEE